MSGVNVFSAGDFLGAAGTEQIVLSDPGFGTYKKLVIAGDNLAGAVLFGDTADSLWYLDLIRSGRPISNSATISPSAAPLPNARRRNAMSGDFTPDQKRYLEGFVRACRPRAPQKARRTAAAQPQNRSGLTPSISRRRIASPRPVESSPTRKNSSARSIRSMPMRG